MSQRTALQAILHGESPDDLCQFEWGYWPETIDRWHAEGLPADQEPWEATGITYYHRVPVETRIFPPFEHLVLSEDAEHQVVRDSNGIVKEITRYHTSFPRFLKHPVESQADFTALQARLDPATPGRFPADWPAVTRKLAERDSILVMGGVEISFFGWHRDLMGVENLLTAYYDQPELIHAISEQHLDFLKTIYTRIAAGRAI